MSRVVVLVTTVLFASSTFAASLASAGEPQTRQIRQRARIHTGVEKGTLVPREARSLRHEQKHIAKAKQRMKKDDGKLDPVEKARLERMQTRASRHISRAKHNARVR